MGGLTLNSGVNRPRDYLEGGVIVICRFNPGAQAGDELLIVGIDLVSPVAVAAVIRTELLPLPFLLKKDSTSLAGHRGCLRSLKGHALRSSLRSSTHFVKAIGR